MTPTARIPRQAFAAAFISVPARPMGHENQNPMGTLSAGPAQEGTMPTPTDVDPAL